MKYAPLVILAVFAGVAIYWIGHELVRYFFAITNYVRYHI
jgi:hypothetical protein